MFRYFPIDLGKSVVVYRQSVLLRNAMIILAFHWPCEGDQDALIMELAINIDIIKEIISDQIPSY